LSVYGTRDDRTEKQPKPKISFPAEACDNPADHQYEGGRKDTEGGDYSQQEENRKLIEAGNRQTDPEQGCDQAGRSKDEAQPPPAARNAEH